MICYKNLRSQENSDQQNAAEVKICAALELEYVCSFIPILDTSLDV